MTEHNESINITVNSSKKSNQLITNIEQQLLTLLSFLPPKLQQILTCMLSQIRQQQTKYAQQQKRLLRQIQQKDKLILSLTKINNSLLKENSRMKKKSDAQFQYFVKRIAQTQCNALNDKKKLEETIAVCQAMIGKMGVWEENKKSFIYNLGIQDTNCISKLENSLILKVLNVSASPKASKGKSSKNVAVVTDSKRQMKQSFNSTIELKTYKSMIQPNPEKCWQSNQLTAMI